MSKIELSPEEIKVIQEYMRGEIGLFTATPRQRKYFTSVLDKANGLVDEKIKSGEDVDFGEDLVRWFWEKYKEQEEIK